MILDTAGQEDFTALRNRWIDGRDGFIVAMDVTKIGKDQIDKYAQWISNYHL